MKDFINIMNDNIKDLFGYGKYQTKTEKTFLRGYWFVILMLVLTGVIWSVLKVFNVL